MTKKAERSERSSYPSVLVLVPNTVRQSAAGTRPMDLCARTSGRDCFIMKHDVGSGESFITSFVNGTVNPPETSMCGPTAIRLKVGAN